MESNPQCVNFNTAGSFCFLVYFFAILTPLDLRDLSLGLSLLISGRSFSGRKIKRPNAVQDRPIFPKEGSTVMNNVSNLSPLSPEQIGQVEYLIQQSIKGHHVLFDVPTLRKILKAGNNPEGTQTLSLEQAQAIENHIEALLRQPSLAEKRAYLESLDSFDFTWVVKTYFNIIESNVYESQETHH